MHGGALALHGAPRMRQRTGRIREIRMNNRVLVPVPIGQSEASFAGQFLTDSLEVKKVGAVPGKKMTGAVLTKIEAARDRAMDGRLSAPAARVSARQRSHLIYGIFVDCDGAIDIG